MENLIKCSSCAHWNRAQLDNCESCGEALHKERIERRLERERVTAEQVGWEVPVVKIKDHYPWYLKAVLQVVRLVQLTGLAIGGMVAWSAWWAAA